MNLIQNLHFDNIVVQKKIRKILVVDDSSSTRNLIQFHLSSAGYNVIEAVDGEDGLSKSKSQLFDVIFIDQYMPKMDGIQLITTIRKPNPPNNKNQNTPIILMSTETSETLKVPGRTAGATGWIPKPVDPQRLISIITYYCSNKK